MLIFHRSADLKAYAANQPQWHCNGFVPTMGALHAGHLSLIAQAKQKHPLVVASIFVNPTQFNDAKDFEQYPVTTAADIVLLENAGCDVLFLPDVAEMYPQGLETEEIYHLGPLETLLEGYYRPGHFQGVCRVVHRLFDKVKPEAIFMGAKDFQQCMVIQRLIDTRQLPVALQICPTMRDPDGLAMSSRNLRLSADARQHATALYLALNNISRQASSCADARLLEKIAAQQVLQAGFTKVDYISIAHPATLLPAEALQAGQTYVALGAAFLDGVRLIDNLLFMVD